MKLHMFFNATVGGMSGGDKRALEMLSYFLKNAILCTVYAPDKFFEIMECEGIRASKSVVTSTSNSQNNGLILKYIIHTFKAIEKIITKDKNIIFYSTSAYLPDLIPSIYGKWRNKNSKIIVPVFHLIEHFSTRPGLKLRNFIAFCEQKVSLFLVKHTADRILVINPLVLEYLHQRGFPMNRVKLVDCGVDENLISKSQAFSDPEHRFDAIYMGRLVPSKGIFELIEIWEKVIHQKPGLLLAIIGSGTNPVVDELKMKINNAGLNDKIYLMGYIENSKAYSYLKSSKVFVFPSHEEGWGIAIADAMACGLPVVTYDLPVYEHIFQNINCEVPVGDTDCMARMIVDLIEDDSRRETLRLDGQKLINRYYTWNRVAKRESEIIYELDQE